MKTTFKHCLDGTTTASGVVIVIDVFRASNTILMLLSQGVSSLIPVMTVGEAFDLKRKDPDCWLVGERKGITVAGFDMGNSPHEAARKDLRGRQVIMTTSAGTKAILQARRADRIFIGSFGNARRLVHLLKQMSPPLVTWFPVGTGGVLRAIEDDLCARYLDGMLRGEAPRFTSLKEEILTGEGAERLRGLGQERDFRYCLSTDLFDFVPEAVWPRSRGARCEVIRC